MRELAPMVDAVPPAERVGLARLLDTALAAVGQG